MQKKSETFLIAKYKYFIVNIVFRQYIVIIGDLSVFWFFCFFNGEMVKI